MFGRKPSRLDAQRTALAEIAPDMAEIGALLAAARSRQALLGQRPTLDVVLRSAEAMTGIYADMTRHFETTKTEDPRFDGAMAAIRTALADQRPVLAYFAFLGDGIALARQQGNGSPSTAEAWQALLEHGEAQAAAMRAEISQLKGLKAKHVGIWPAKLDLDAMQVGVDDAAKALAIYRGHLAGHGDFVPAQARSLGTIIGMFANSFNIIAYERQNLAVAIVTQAAMKRHPSGS